MQQHLLAVVLHKNNISNREFKFSDLHCAYEYKSTIKDKIRWVAMVQSCDLIHDIPSIADESF